MAKNTPVTAITIGFAFGEAQGSAFRRDRGARSLCLNAFETRARNSLPVSGCASTQTGHLKLNR